MRSSIVESTVDGSLLMLSEALPPINSCLADCSFLLSEAVDNCYGKKPSSIKRPFIFSPRCDDVMA